MIEQQLRDEFARRESEVPGASFLAARIRAATKRRRRSQRVMRSSAAVLAVVLVALGAPLVARQWTAVPLPFGPAASGTGVPAGPLNFLVVGLDRRPSSPASSPVRADAIIIAHVPADRSGVQLVTIPRDLWVDVPSRPERHSMKINQTWSVGGLPLLEQTLTELTGLTFHGSIVADLAGLAGLVDQLGGIDYCIDQPITSLHTGRNYEVGCRSFDGDQLSDLLRQRTNLPNGALDQDRHNAQFLAALIKKVANSGLGDLGRLRALYESLRSYVTVDAQGLDPVAMAWELRGAAASVEYTGMQVRHRQDATAGYLVPGSNAASLFEALRTDTVPAWIVAHQNDPLFE